MAFNVRVSNRSNGVEQSLILIGLSCFNNHSNNGGTDSTANSVNKGGCGTLIQNKGLFSSSVHTTGKSAQQVDAVVYVVVVLTIYTSAMLALLIKYMRKDTNNRNHSQGDLLNYYRHFYGKGGSCTAGASPAVVIENPQVENRERLRETQRALERLYGQNWMHLYNIQPSKKQQVQEECKHNQQHTVPLNQVCHCSTAKTRNGLITHNGKAGQSSNNSIMTLPIESVSDCHACQDRTDDNCGCNKGHRRVEVLSPSSDYFEGCSSSDDLFSVNDAEFTDADHFKSSRRPREHYVSDDDERFDADILTELTRSDSGFLSQAESCHSVQSYEEIDETGPS